MGNAGYLVALSVGFLGKSETSAKREHVSKVNNKISELKELILS
jgi:hypothetical protein